MCPRRRQWSQGWGPAVLASRKSPERRCRRPKGPPRRRSDPRFQTRRGQCAMRPQRRCLGAPCPRRRSRLLTTHRRRQSPSRRRKRRRRSSGESTSPDPRHSGPVDALYRATERATKPEVVTANLPCLEARCGASVAVVGCERQKVLTHAVTRCRIGIICTRHCCLHFIAMALRIL